MLGVHSPASKQTVSRTVTRKADWLSAAAAWGSTLLVLVAVLLASAVASDGSIDTNTGGRTALIVLGLIALLPLLVRRLRISGPRWLPWVIGASSVVITVVLGVLMALDRQNEAWALYAFLNLLRAREHFGDLFLVLQYLECDGCTFLIYGPGLLWIDRFIPGQTQTSWTPFLGYALAVALGLALVWLVRNSSGRALPVFILAAIGPSWLLLLDRGNLDGLVVVVAVLAVIVLRRKPTLPVFTAVAILFWILGTWKYYPFALGLLLLPALQLRRGWIVVGLYSAALAAFVAGAWSDVSQGSQENLVNVLTYDFPAFGSIPIIERMTIPSVAYSDIIASGLLALMSIAAFMWGMRFGRHVRTQSPWIPLLALAGSVMFFFSIGIAGFGFAYKAAFLMMAVPLLSLPRSSSPRFALYTSLVALILVGITLIVGYSILLTSLAGLIASALGIGASTTYLVGLLRDLRKPRSANSTRQQGSDSLDF